MAGNALPTNAPDNMNLNALVYTNIIGSPYFRGLYEKKTYHEVLQEIYDKVDSLEPFMKGTVASTAYCLLYKLWVMRLTVRQVDGMLKKDDNGHIRALALLYLRYTLPPVQLWEWFEPYLEDEEEVKVERGPPPRYMTIGEIAYTLLTSTKWLGSMLPRIPVPAAKTLEPLLAPFRAKYAAGGGGMEGPRGGGVGGRPDTRFPPGTRAAGSGLGESRGKDDRGKRDGSRERAPVRYEDRDRPAGGGRYEERQRSRDRDRYGGDSRGYGEPRGYGGYAGDARGYGGAPYGGYGRGGYEDRDRYRERDGYERARDERAGSSAGKDSFGRDIDRERPRSRDRERDYGSEKKRERSRSPRRDRERSRDR